MKEHVGMLTVLGVGLAACYYQTLNWMYGRFVSPDSYYSHGFIIPLVSGYFIWKMKDRLKAVVVKRSEWGLALLFIAILLHIAGTVLYIFSLSGLSLFLFITGGTLFLFGEGVFKRILFPLVFLLFMFPLPEAFINLLSFPLKMLVAEIGMDMVKLLGIPILREGFQITIPAGQLIVGNPCSGLRSIIALLALSSIFAHMCSASTSKKAVLFLSALPIAVLSNIVRVSLLILISYFQTIEAAKPDSFWHDATGVLVFVMSITMLFALGRLVKCRP